MPNRHPGGNVEQVGGYTNLQLGAEIGAEEILLRPESPQQIDST